MQGGWKQLEFKGPCSNSISVTQEIAQDAMLSEETQETGPNIMKWKSQL